MPQLSPDVGTAVEQLITLLTQQKNALATQANQIHDLTVQVHSGRVDDRQIHALMDRVAKAEVFMRKVSGRVDTLEKDETAFDDELKAGAALAASVNVRIKDQTVDIAKLQDDLVLFWRMTFLERLAWLLGGARLFKQAARLLAWWRTTQWRH